MQGEMAVGCALSAQREGSVYPEQPTEICNHDMYGGGS